MSQTNTVSNVKTLRNNVYQFETVLDAVGPVVVKAYVLKDRGSYWDPPCFETEIHAVTHNGIDLCDKLSEAQFDTLEALADVAYDEEQSAGEPDDSF